MVGSRPEAIKGIKVRSAAGEEEARRQPAAMCVVLPGAGTPFASLDPALLPTAWCRRSVHASLTAGTTTASLQGATRVQAARWTRLPVGGTPGAGGGAGVGGKAGEEGDWDDGKAPAEPWCEQEQHKKVLAQGRPEDGWPGIKDKQVGRLSVGRACEAGGFLPSILGAGQCGLSGSCSGCAFLEECHALQKVNPWLLVRALCGLLAKAVVTACVPLHAHRRYRCGTISCTFPACSTARAPR